MAVASARIRGVSEIFVPTVFVVDDGVCSFGSVEAMLRYFEPWDVTEQTRVFDSNGRRIVVRAEGVQRTRFTVGGGVVKVDVESSGADESFQLLAALRSYVLSVGPERSGVSAAEADAADLGRLVPVAHRLAASE